MQEGNWKVMNTQQIKQEMERLRPQLTEANSLFLDEVSRRVSASPLNGPAAAYALLDTARQMLKDQNRGRSYLERYSYDPEVYTEELLTDLEMRRPRTLRDKVKYYTMIPWIALTWVFFIYTFLGFMNRWFKGEAGEVTVKLPTLILIAAGSLLLMELMTRFLGAPDSQNSTDGRRPLKAELKSAALTIGTAIVVVALYAMLQQMLPAFTLSVWTCLGLFAAGLAGQYFFLRKPRRNRAD
ncbi:DUF1129 family protein [Paenibacillus pinistramenti]|uniref:DUF1129 family protein n=1 Tax=Paenibacillus pinistramenti TaxID=1768003 RepID=UPI001396B015|nr:DUF1129 family protein [Paenibacillus pinistramenti]